MNTNFKKKYKTLKLHFMQNLHLLLFCISLIFGSAILQAQAIELNAFTDKESYLIGEPITLTLDLKRPIEKEVVWPFIAETIGPFDILVNGKIDTVVTNDVSNEIQQFKIAAYDSGNYVIPKIEFEYEGKRNRINKIATPEIIVRINTVAIDTTQNIKPIKPNLEVPVTLRERLPYIIGGLFLLGALIGLILFIRKRNRKEEPEYIPPPLKPYQLALKSLDALKAKELWQQGKSKSFYSELTEILRNYIEGRFDINALEMTSDEIGRAIKKKKEVKKGLYRNAVDLLQMADLVKFAKAFPSSRLNEENFKSVEGFVESTCIKTEGDNLILAQHKEANQNKGKLVKDKDSWKLRKARKTALPKGPEYFSDYQVASPIFRILAFVIDAIVGILLFIVMWLISFIFGGVLALFSANLTVSIIFTILILILPAFVYDVLSERYMRGQTFGKKLVKIKVISEDGHPVKFSQSIIRFIFKILGNFTASIVGLLMVLFSEKNQRFGDKRAKTVVIKVDKSTMQIVESENLSVENISKENINEKIDEVKEEIILSDKLSDNSKVSDIENEFVAKTVYPDDKPKSNLDKYLARKEIKEQKKKLQNKNKNAKKGFSFGSLFKKKQK